MNKRIAKTYSDLYKKTVANLKDKEMELPLSEQGFLKSLSYDDGNCDLFDLHELDNKDFFEVIIRKVYNRKPLPEDYEIYEKHKNSHQAYFQKKVIRHIQRDENWRKGLSELSYNLYPSSFIKTTLPKMRILHYGKKIVDKISRSLKCI